jgi:hypothetical protein
MVQLHRSSERQQRLKLAKRHFTQRWASVSQSLGIAASAVAMMQQRRSGGNGGTSSLRRRQSQKQEEGLEPSNGRRVSFAAAASAQMAASHRQPAAAAVPAALPTSPFESRPAVVAEAVRGQGDAEIRASDGGGTHGGGKSGRLKCLHCLSGPPI